MSVSLRCCWFFFCLSWLLFSSSANASPLFRQFQQQDGLPHPVVSALAEDQRGFLWIGTPGGLVRYDGYQFRQVQIHGAQNQAVSALASSPDGVLWLALNNGEIWQADPLSLEFTRLDITDLGSVPGFTLADGQLWISSLNGLWRVDLATLQWQKVGAEQGLPAGKVYSVVSVSSASPSGSAAEVWLSTATGVYHRAAQATRFRLAHATAVPWTKLRLVGDNHIFAGDSQGQVWQLDRHSGLVAALFKMPQPSQIKEFIPFADGRLWALSYTAGLVQWSAQTGQVMQWRADRLLPHSLSSDTLLAACADSSGLYWLGTSNGLLLYDPATDGSQLFHASTLMTPGLATATPLSLAEAGTDRYWLGFDQPYLQMLDTDQEPARLSPPTEVRGLAAGTAIYAIAQQQQQIMLGTLQGLYQLELPDFNARRLAAVPVDAVSSAVWWQGFWWAGTVSQGLFQLSPAGQLVQHWRFDAPQSQHRLSDNSITALLVEPEAGLWIGTGRGLNLIQHSSEPGQFQADYQTAFAPAGRVQSISAGHAGEIWLTGQQGVLQKTKAARAFVKPQLHLPWPQPVAAVTDLHGRLWLSSALGLARQQSGQAGFRLLNRADGIWLQQYWSKAALRTSGGRLLFAGAGGVQLVTPQPDVTAAPAQLAISQVRVDGTEVSPALLAELAPSALLQISFTAQDHRQGKARLFQYRLGPEQAWVDADADSRLASYQQLWPGHYQWQLRTRLPGTDWSEPVTLLQIEQQPAFWQRGIFLLMVLLLVAVMLWGLYRMQLRRLEQRAALLEELVALRTGELADSNRQLVAAQQQLVLSEKMASLGTLTAGVAHEINNPVNFADGATQVVQQQLADFRQFLRELAGPDADAEVLQALMQRCDQLEKLTGVAREGHQRIKTIVQDLRSFTRLDQAELLEVRLSEIIHSTVNLVKTQFAGVRFELQLTEDPLLWCYPAKLGQLLLNLLVNSCDACAGIPEPTIAVQLKQCKDRLLLVVQDNGCGMTEEVRQKIFEPFFTTKAVGSGSGLGMAIVYGIVQQHHARIEVESAPGKGCTVTISFVLSTRP